MLGIGKSRRLPNVLIIDDDLVSREVMATVLTMCGYTVHTANNGAESLELLDSRSVVPEVILMDTQMPGLNGAELIRELRARSLAVLYAISGSNPPEDVIKGADGFLMKPIGPEALRRVMQQHSPEVRPVPPPGLPVINPQTLAELRKIMPEKAVREVYAAVVADLGKRRGMLELALAQRNIVEAHRIGHSIKGGCGMAGAQEAAHIGQMIETGGDDLEYIGSLLPHLEAAAASLKRMLDAEFLTPGK
jgi:CheY-like chemotaxis protein/HPt (histidine-containing phosphotransfer) domain-containing protein